MMKPSQLFYVSLKAVVMKDDKVLLMHQNNDLWEFPGGRIDPGEENIPLETILRREIAEECGLDFQIRVGRILRVWTAPYNDGVYGLIIEHLCQYGGGEIVISNEHKGFRWVDQGEWKPLPFACGQEGYPVTLNKLWDKLDQS